jgi:23S rRNA (uracil1939-C5)-methyltransferase
MTLRVTIDRLGRHGDGIARTPEGPVFVPNTAPGDVADIDRAGKTSDGAWARLVTLVTPGPDRVTAPCPHAGTCGGCATQHLSAVANAVWKHGLVAHALHQNGIDVAPQPTLTTPPATRRRADFAAHYSRDGFVLGFHAPRSRTVVGLTTCHVLHPTLRDALPALAELARLALPKFGSVDLKVTLTNGGLDVLLVTQKPFSKDILAALRTPRAPFVRLSVQVGEAVSDPLWGQAFVTLGGADVLLPPGGFLQASAEGEALLVTEVLKGVGDAGRVADLFTGAGTFALPLARAGKNVYAAEGDADSIAALFNAARKANLPGTLTTSQRDLFKKPLTSAELAAFDVVVIDPPRAGAQAQAAEIARSAVPRVVSVSCDPVTFARDAKILARGGYALTSVVPVDQFVWAAHVEVVGVFVRT